MIRTARRIKPRRLFAVSRPSPARNHGKPSTKVPMRTMIPDTGVLTTRIIAITPRTATTAYKMLRLMPMSIKVTAAAMDRMASPISRPG
jgi:hypothetical protein